MQSTVPFWPHLHRVAKNHRIHGEVGAFVTVPLTASMHVFPLPARHRRSLLGKTPNPRTSVRQTKFDVTSATRSRAYCAASKKILLSMPEVGDPGIKTALEIGVSELWLVLEEMRSPGYSSSPEGETPLSVDRSNCRRPPEFTVPRNFRAPPRQKPSERDVTLFSSRSL